MFVCGIQLQAQKYKGQQNLSFGLGWHTNGFVEKAYKNTLKPEGLSTSTMLVPSINYDMGFSDRISLGLSFSQYQVSSKFNGYTDVNSIYYNSSSNTITLNTTDFGLRILYHFGDNDDFDPYLGVKGGYSIHKYRSNVNHGFSASKLNDELGKNSTSQAFFGFRYFVSERLGFGFEFAAGQTYNAKVSLDIRLGSM